MDDNTITVMFDQYSGMAVVPFADYYGVYMWDDVMYAYVNQEWNPICGPAIANAQGLPEVARWETKQLAIAFVEKTMGVLHWRVEE